jgi:hypothetical protein
MKRGAYILGKLYFRKKDTIIIIAIAIRNGKGTGI